MEPESGRCSRIISRSSVDLPEPLPPISANISARRTSRSSSECTTWSPKRVDTLLISMTASSRMRLRFACQRSSALKAIENRASATITRKIDWTTLRVVWRPTLSAPPLVRKP